MNPINTALKFLGTGVKTKRKSYLLRGWRKMAFYSVLILFMAIGWTLIIYLLYKFVA